MKIITNTQIYGVHCTEYILQCKRQNSGEMIFSIKHCSPVQRSGKKVEKGPKGSFAAAALLILILCQTLPVVSLTDSSSPHVQIEMEIEIHIQIEA